MTLEADHDDDDLFEGIPDDLDGIPPAEFQIRSSLWIRRLRGRTHWLRNKVLVILSAHEKSTAALEAMTRQAADMGKKMDLIETSLSRIEGAVSFLKYAIPASLVIGGALFALGRLVGK